MDEAAGSFDFEAHGTETVANYKDLVRFYEDFSETVRSILETSLAADHVQVHSIEARAKKPDSLKRKAMRPSASDPTLPRYPRPLTDCTDLAAARVITFFLETVASVSNVIEREFDVVERITRSSLHDVDVRVGYQSIHYLVRLKDTRLALPEYARFSDSIAELQVRTILQHAWAEIEHDIQYKSVETLPTDIRRRFLSLAGLLEIADREFQAIAEANEQVRTEAASAIESGRFDSVEITPDALKAFLDKQLGADGRMSDWSYEWNARLLRRLGFDTIEQLSLAMADINDDKVTRAIWGSRQGQLQRLQDVVLAAMGGGEDYWTKHPYADELWFREARAPRLERLSRAGVTPRDYDPKLMKFKNT